MCRCKARRAEHVGGEIRRVHRRDKRRDVARAFRALRHSRPQRTAHPVRRDRRHREQETPRRHRVHAEPILCIGETLEQRDAGEVEEVLAAQLSGSLAGLTAKDIHDTVLAYEPVWAIGTGRTATPEQAQDAHAFIRKTIGALFDDTTAAKIRIQYGAASSRPTRNRSCASRTSTALLVGGASLEARAFAEIVHATAKCV